MTHGSPEAGDDDPNAASPATAPLATPAALASETEALAARSGSVEDEDEEDDDDEEDEEPKLKYARLTPHLGAVYRNGDATSSFLVAGDKMIIGSHNGNIVSTEHPPSYVRTQY